MRRCQHFKKKFIFFDISIPTKKGVGWAGMPHHGSRPHASASSPDTPGFKPNPPGLKGNPDGLAPNPSG